MHIVNPIRTQSQGTADCALRKLPAKLPMLTPITIPINPPNIQRIIASNKN